jgi:hypothetical protein
MVKVCLLSLCQIKHKQCSSTFCDIIPLEKHRQNGKKKKQKRGKKKKKK